MKGGGGGGARWRRWRIPHATAEFRDLPGPEGRPHSRTAHRRNPGPTKLRPPQPGVGRWLLSLGDRHTCQASALCLITGNSIRNGSSSALLTRGKKLSGHSQSHLDLDVICGVDAFGREQQRRHRARHNWKTRTVKRVRRMHRVLHF